MAEPFEDPRKTELRARCEIAVDAAGYELVTEPVTFQTGPELRGGIRGDLQSVDSDGSRYSYYLRVDPSKAVAQWLVNLARAARATQDVSVFVVVAERHPTLERSCRAGQVGLLLLTEDNAFEMLVDPDVDPEEQNAAKVTAKAREARRRMETKLRLNTSTIENNYARVNDLTAGMPSDVRDSYIDNVEQSATAWEEWGQHVSTMLDEAAVNGDESLLQSAEHLIEEGVDV